MYKTMASVRDQETKSGRGSPTEERHGQSLRSDVKDEWSVYVIYLTKRVSSVESTIGSGQCNDMDAAACVAVNDYFRFGLDNELRNLSRLYKQRPLVARNRLLLNRLTQLSEHPRIVKYREDNTAESRGALKQKVRKSVRRLKASKAKAKASKAKAKASKAKSSKARASKARRKATTSTSKRKKNTMRRNK
jgi:hypothetical protein